MATFGVWVNGRFIRADLADKVTFTVAPAHMKVALPAMVPTGAFGKASPYGFGLTSVVGASCQL